DKIVSFRALCPLTAKLTVRTEDPGKADTTTKTANVGPRPWKVRFVLNQTPKKYTVTHLVPLGEHSCECQFGRNVCTKDGLTGDQSSGHQIHKDPPNAQTWVDVG